MPYKEVSSTEVQTKFRQVIEEVQNHTIFVVTKHRAANALILSLHDFTQILDDPNKKQEILDFISDLRLPSGVGRVISSKSKVK